MSANQIVHAMLSHRGLVRRGNEDSCAACIDAGAFVVCDGMGGAAAGEVASRLAAETFLDYLRQPAADGAPATSEARLAAAVCAANQAVYRYSRQSPRFAGMGTTLVALLAPALNGHGNGAANGNGAAGDALWLANVGDSRCYRLRAGHLEQLTHDHSFVEEQLRAGQITAAQAALSPLRNIITRSIGSRSCVEPEIQSDHAMPGDLYLLTSDGLTHELADPEIESILASVPAAATQLDLSRACEVLIASANRHGGHDNTTVLLISLP
jgi:protein phosphatase